MQKVFLSAEWKNLLMANYAIDPSVLRPYVPRFTELDQHGGTCYVSLVGFLFANTRVKGLPVPFHRNFEEVNLRFYVRYKQKGQWLRGVVFIKEIVPKPMISLVANLFYGEKYVTHRMRHQWTDTPNGLAVAYEWLVGNKWNYIRAEAEKETVDVDPNSTESFITEHYWGYTTMQPMVTGAYEVKHPRWQIHRVRSYDVQCSVEQLYGPAFKEALSAPPQNVFLAKGSAVQVMNGSKIVTLPA